MACDRGARARMSQIEDRNAGATRIGEPIVDFGSVVAMAPEHSSDEGAAGMGSTPRPLETPEGEPGNGRNVPGEPARCDDCTVGLLLTIIAGCYTAGFGGSGWLALGVALNVWLVGWLLLADRA